MRRGMIAISAWCVALAACGDGAPEREPDAPTVDAATGSDVPDATVLGPRPDAGPPPPCNASDSLGALGAVNDGAATLDLAFIENDTDLRIDYNGRFQDQHVLRLLFIEGLGAFAGGFAPGTYDITGDDTNIDTCGACVLVFTKFTQPAQSNYLIARGGTLTLERIDETPDGRLVGTATDLELTRYIWDGQQQVLFEDCTSRIDSVSFDVPLEPGPSFPEE